MHIADQRKPDASGNGEMECQQCTEFFGDGEVEKSSAGTG